MRECVREAELLEALQTTAWPDCCAADLREHVSQCDSCKDLVAIVEPLLDEHRAATLEAQVPPSAVVWWRAERRARLEAAQTAATPITALQWVSGACAAGLMAGAIGYASPAMRGMLLRVRDTTVDLASTGQSPISTISWTELIASPVGMAAFLALTMALVLAPLAIYLSASDS